VPVSIAPPVIEVAVIDAAQAAKKFTSGSFIA
jgi:hypothetical protein